MRERRIHAEEGRHAAGRVPFLLIIASRKRTFRKAVEKISAVSVPSDWYVLRRTLLLDSTPSFFHATPLVSPALSRAHALSGPGTGPGRPPLSVRTRHPDARKYGQRQRGPRPSLSGVHAPELRCITGAGIRPDRLYLSGARPGGLRPRPAGVGHRIVLHRSRPKHVRARWGGRLRPVRRHEHRERPDLQPGRRPGVAARRKLAIRRVQPWVPRRPGVDHPGPPDSGWGHPLIGL